MNMESQKNYYNADTTQNTKDTSESHLIGKIDVSEVGIRSKMYVGDLTGDGRMDILMVQPDGGIDNRYVPHQVQSMTAFDLDGTVLWWVGECELNTGDAGSD